MATFEEHVLRRVLALRLDDLLLIFLSQVQARSLHGYLKNDPARGVLHFMSQIERGWGKKTLSYKKVDLDMQKLRIFFVKFI